METYLVGGAVRDQLLGLTVKDRDWVVVGATEQAMLDRGFIPVGKDFPVFLHPETNEEHALARTERKTAPGYHGFQAHAAPDVTLEDDLARRDLTINAMAMDEAGEVIDPFGGQKDLEARLLRHVSPAFAEDPLRILRVARFAARYARLGFQVADETRALMTEMVDSGEVDALVPERAWQEVERALGEPTPARFFEVLRDCGALDRLFPEIDRLFGVPQPEKYHPEIDTGIHSLMVLEQAAGLSEEPPTRLAALLHDVGKGLTPPERWPSHRGHEELGAPEVEALCQRFRAPNAFRDLALLVARYHTDCHRSLEMRPSRVLTLLETADAFRRPERFREFVLACEADARGRKGFADRPYPQAEWLDQALTAARSVDARPFVEQGIKGEEIARAIRQARIRAIQAVKDEFAVPNDAERPIYADRGRN